MITECTRCGHEIDTDTAEGAEQGITRAWDGPEEGYRDYHKLCRDLTVKERREARRPGQVAQGSSSRRQGSKAKAAATPAAVVDEME